MENAATQITAKKVLVAAHSLSPMTAVGANKYWSCEQKLSKVLA